MKHWLLVTVHMNGTGCAKIKKNTLQTNSTTSTSRYTYVRLYECMLVCIYLYLDIRGSVSTIVVRIQNLRESCGSFEVHIHTYIHTSLFHSSTLSAPTSPPPSSTSYYSIQLTSVPWFSRTASCRRRCSLQWCYCCCCSGCCHCRWSLGEQGKSAL